MSEPRSGDCLTCGYRSTAPWDSFGHCSDPYHEALIETKIDNTIHALVDTVGGFFVCVTRAWASLGSVLRRHGGGRW